MQRTFQTPKPIAISVRLAGGDLSVEAVDTAETVVDIVSRNPGRERYLDQVRVECRGDVLIVEAPKGPLGGILELGVSVRCPRSSSLEAVTASADVRTIGLLARLNVTTASGDLRAQETAGDARVVTASGDVALGVVGGPATVTSASGDVNVQHAAGLRAATASGDLSAREIEGDVRATTASGDLDLSAVGRGDIRVKTVSGDVYLGVKPGCDVWMDVRTLSGEVTSELDGSQEPPADRSRLVELRIETTSGDVQISRAQAHART